MNKEEKKAIEELNRFANGIDMSCVTARQMKIILNLIEKLQDDKEELQKENEELKEDRKNNNEMILLAQNEILKYMSGYEDGKKQIEKYEESIKRLQKENELLRQQNISYKNNINELKKKYEGDN